MRKVVWGYGIMYNCGAGPYLQSIKQRADKNMSANNQLIIRKQGKNWTVSNIDTDTGEGFLISYKRYKTLELAVKAAHDYMRKHGVEYGLDIRI